MEKNYRKGIIAIVLDLEDNFLILQLQVYADTNWSFLGGGTNPNESAEETLKKELIEELGITDKDYEIISKSPVPQKYDFPESIIKNEKGIIYHGQVKETFLVRFTGDKDKVSLQEEEVRKHKWVSFSELKTHLNFPGQYEHAVRTLKLLYPSVICD